MYANSDDTKACTADASVRPKYSICYERLKETGDERRQKISMGALVKNAHNNNWLAKH